MKKHGLIRSHCPISFALDVFGDKWSLLIIRDILIRGKKTYGEFLESDEKIATNILMHRLERLEEQKIIRCKKDANDGRIYSNALTRKGIDLLPILLEMVLWSWNYDPKTKTPPEFARSLQKDRAKLIKEILLPIKTA